MKQIIIFLLTFNFIFGQSDTPLTLRAQFNGSYGYTIIGNTHNEFDNWQQNPIPACEMQTQSSAILNLQPNQSIVNAYLYWSSVGDGTFNPIVVFNGINHVADEIFIGYPEPNLIVDYCGAYKDVTSQVIATGNGTYNFSNLDLNPIIGDYCSQYYSGWHLVVVYSQSIIPNQQLNIYDGFNICFDQFNDGVTPVTINNLNVVDNQNAQMTYVAYNGSPNLFFNESITFNSNLLSNALNPVDNPFNGTNSITGNSINWNQDIDTFDISSYITIGNTQANIVFKSFFLELFKH